MRLTDDDRHRIQAAVHAAEERTGIHIAVAVVPASDRYALYPLVWGALLALAAGGVGALVMPSLPSPELFAFEAAVFVVLSIGADWWPIRMRLVPGHVRRARASALAHREFAARILTGGKSGLLLFVSLSERYAELIADRTLHAQVGTEGWNRIVADLVRAASSGRVADGIAEALSSCAVTIHSRTP